MINDSWSGEQFFFTASVGLHAMAQVQGTCLSQRCVCCTKSKVQKRGRLWRSLSAFLSAILSGFTLLSAFLSAQKSKTTQKRALKSKYAFLSAQKRAQTSGFAQKSAQLRSFAQKRAQLSGPLKKVPKRGIAQKTKSRSATRNKGCVHQQTWVTR